jgi:hypothetical protein
MQNIFLQKLLDSISTLDIVGESSSLKPIASTEEVIGEIKNEDTKKLFYYFSQICEAKIKVAEIELKKFAGSDINCLANRKEEAEKAIAHILELIESQFLVAILFKKAVKEEIEIKHCYRFHIAKGWKIVKPKCSECVKSLQNDLRNNLNETLRSYGAHYSSQN